MVWHGDGSNSTGIWFVSALGGKSLDRVFVQYGFKELKTMVNYILFPENGIRAFYFADL
jgi:hypothetical protein